MNDQKLEQFVNQRYVNLETFRKTGKAVATPVWFAEKDGVLYAYSATTAGKVKRIRNSSRVRITPCDMRGTPRGTWIEAQARIVDGEQAALGIQLLNEKYGWQKRLVDFFSGFKGTRPAVIAIQV